MSLSKAEGTIRTVEKTAVVPSPLSNQGLFASERPPAGPEGLQDGRLEAPAGPVNSFSHYPTINHFPACSTDARTGLQTEIPDRPPGYLEHIANVREQANGGNEKKSSKIPGWLDGTCDHDHAGFFIPGECLNGHRIAKALVCGKEWCSTCGEDGSLAHRRRFARWLPKAMQIKSMGYFVFTIPEDLRDQYRTKEALRRIGRQVQELLKVRGFKRGLRRWHFFGDKSSKWHPHLNILVDGGYLDQELINEIREAYAGLLGATVADVHYEYRRSPGRMVHTLKYVTRATFHDYTWDIDMAQELRGFRNMVVWGKNEWNLSHAWEISDIQGKTRGELEKWDLEALEKISAGQCPVCGEAITWQLPLPIGLLDIADKIDYGCGYYLVKGPAPPRPRDFTGLKPVPKHDREHYDVQEAKKYAAFQYSGHPEWSGPALAGADQPAGPGQAQLELADG